MSKDYSNTNILGLSYPVITLSPMDGVSDSAYRQITRKYSTLANGGKTSPDLMITEFTHVMGLCYAAENVLHHFKYQEMERPLIAQIYGAEPEYFYHAAKIVCALGFDGVDINMGCPAQNVASSGAGAGLIRTPDKAKAIIEETKRGVADWVADGKVTGMKKKGHEYLMRLVEEYKKRLENRDSNFEDDSIVQISNLKSRISNLSNGQLNLLGETRVPIPVSVKTRIGYNEIITESWIKHISDQKPYFISVHGRTLKQAYGGEANWDELKKAVEIAEVPVLTNGDIKVYSDIQRMLDYTGSFGVLAGRATEGNPLFFGNQNSEIREQIKFPINPISNFQKESVIRNAQFVIDNSDLTPTLSSTGEGVAQSYSLQTTNYNLQTIMLEHAELFIQNKPDPRAFVQMRKNFGWYTQTMSKEILNSKNLNPKEKEAELSKLKQLRIKLVRVSSLEELRDALSNN